MNLKYLTRNAYAQIDRTQRPFTKNIAVKGFPTPIYSKRSLAHILSYIDKYVPDVCPEYPIADHQQHIFSLKRRLKVSMAGKGVVNQTNYICSSNILNVRSYRDEWDDLVKTKVGAWLSTANLKI